MNAVQITVRRGTDIIATFGATTHENGIDAAMGIVKFDDVIYVVEKTPSCRSMMHTYYRVKHAGLGQPDQTKLVVRRTQQSFIPTAETGR